MDDNHNPLLSRRRHHHHHVGDSNGRSIVISPKIGTSLFEASHRWYHFRQLDIGRHAEALLVHQLSGICRPRQSGDTDAEHADSARVSSRAAATTQTGVVIVIVFFFFFDDDIKPC